MTAIPSSIGNETPLERMERTAQRARVYRAAANDAYDEYDRARTRVVEAQQRAEHAEAEAELAFSSWMRSQQTVEFLLAELGAAGS